jgi:hypothetical protein
MCVLLVFIVATILAITTFTTQVVFVILHFVHQEKWHRLTFTNRRCKSPWLSFQCYSTICGKNMIIFYCLDVFSIKAVILLLFLSRMTLILKVPRLLSDESISIWQLFDLMFETRFLLFQRLALSFQGAYCLLKLVAELLVLTLNFFKALSPNAVFRAIFLLYFDWLISAHF